MNQHIEVRRTYKYRLYRCDKRDGHLHQQINVAGCIWNHALALQKRYYRLTGKYIPLGKLQAHIAKLRMRTPRYAWWQALGSQAVQDVLERLDTAYQRFFQRLAKRPPRFKKVKRYASFTLTQCGWKLVSYIQNQARPNGKYRTARGVICINGRDYKFVQHRPLKGQVKTVQVKRDSLRRLWLCFSVIESVPEPVKATTSRVAGFDFGLKTFLTDHTGATYESPLFYTAGLKRIRTLQRCKDKKPHGTRNRRKAALLLTRTHIRVADQRRDSHYKLAHELCDRYDVLAFEDLNLDGMKRLWGRKVSDLGFGQFLKILTEVAGKRGKSIVAIDRFERTTGKCSHCGHSQNMALRQRTFECASCGLVLDRDHNAALNIYYAGASAYTGLAVVRPASAGSRA
jgi:putative transposase